jgi:DNA-binding Lrp family transcriptional regulator
MEKIPSISSEINKVEVNKFIFNNFNSISPYFYKLISEWMSDAYKIFKDLDKFLILIYLINTDFEFFRRNNLNITYESFYKDKTLEINKINLIQISKDLNIPKESVRRKISELEKKGVIKKKGKKIFLDRSAYESQEPINTLKNVSVLLSKFSEISKKKNLTIKSLDRTEVSKLIKNNFSFCWYQFFKFIFSYCYRWRKYFGDLEIMLIGITIAFNSVTTASIKLKGIESYIDKWREEILQNNIRGINAMSISEITGIPRPTVIRKINYLIKLNMVEMDKNKLLNIKFNNKSYKETSELQNETINDLSVFITRTFNQINFN